MSGSDEGQHYQQEQSIIDEVKQKKKRVEAELKNLIQLHSYMMNGDNENVDKIV